MHKNTTKLLEYIENYCKMQICNFSQNYCTTGSTGRPTWTFRTITGRFVPCWERQHSLYSASQKKSPWGFLTFFFPKRLGIFSPNFTCLLYGRLQIVIQLSPTLTNFDESSSDGTQRAFRPMVDISSIWWWSRLLWHNFVKVADN